MMLSPWYTWGGGCEEKAGYETVGLGGLCL